MKRNLFYVLTAFLVLSCGKKVPEETIIDFKPNKNVISFKIAANLNGNYSEHLPDSLYSRGFDPKMDTIKYEKNEIYVSYVAGLTGCVKYAGDVAVKNDSLLLKLVTINNMACTELDIARVVFKIKNPKNEKFKIGKYIN
jgi:hypothetical protein